MLNLQNFLSECKIEFKTNEKFEDYTTYGLGGKIKIIVFPKSENELKAVLKELNARKIKFMVVGNGSKLLVNSSFKSAKVIIKLEGDFKKLEISGNLIVAGAGCSLSRLSVAAMQNSLAGLEFAVQIPGVLGGGLYMNAGAFGGSVGALVQSVRALNFKGEEIILSKDECNFAYRKSIFNEGKLIAVEATLELVEGDKAQIEEKMEEFRRRRENQPKGKCCGSVFKRAGEKGAGDLIERCNLKGRRIGDAEISTTHANFIMNLGNAKYSDILKLINLCKKEVYKKFKIKLSEEVIKVR